MSRAMRQVVLLAGMGLSSLGWAQSAPVVTGTDASSRAGASTGAVAGGTAGPSAAGSVATLKTAAQLVVVDVVVTDRNHQPVHGLTANDFSLSENGAKQTMKHFEEHSAASAADATKLAPMPKLPPGMYTNYTPVAANGSVTLLLLDSLNTPMTDQAYVRQQLLAYLKNRPPGERIAIFGLSTHLVMLQGFTSDPDLLRKVMEQDKVKASFVLEDKVGGHGVQENTTDDLETRGFATEDAGDNPQAVIESLRQYEAMHETFEIQLRTKYTLDAMNEIARYVSGIPGRKNLIWFSGAFPLDILPDETGQTLDPFAQMGSSEDEYRETITKLSRSQVAVYPIDARGITMSPSNDASTSIMFGGAYGPARLARADAKFTQRNESEHATMDVLAGETGGEAFFNTNGLTQAVAKAVEEGSNFYTLSYTPTDQRQDGKERNIKVQLARAGLTASYRKGYYTDLAEKKGAKTAAASATAASNAGPESLQLAMMHGSPTPAEILIKVAVARMSSTDKPEEHVAVGNLPAATTKGPYQRYSVDYAINPGDLVFLRGEDGKIHIDYDALVYVYNANGELVNWVGRTHPIAGTAEQVQRATVHGLLAHAEISVPIKGEYFLRIAVHDRNRDRYGAVEVATAQVKDVAAASGRQAANPAAKTSTVQLPAAATK